MNVLVVMAGVGASALTHLATDPATFLTGAALLAAVTVVLVASVLPRGVARHDQPAGDQLHPVRAHARPLRVPRHCDPDAADHRRPRAPTTLPSVAQRR